MSEDSGARPVNGSPEDAETGSLTSDERRERIIEVLGQQDEVGVVELSQRLGVSEVTTRKDLQQLEEQGYLTRVRGGAVVSGRGQLELRFAARQQVNLDEKRRIAARSVELINPGSTIFLDGSTTAFQMTRLLRHMQNLTVITTGLYAALELSFAPDVTTIVVGGILRRRTSSLVDALSPKLLRRLHVDIAFLSCRGYSIQHGMMESDLREAQMKRAMAETAVQKIALIDHSKFAQSFVATSLLSEEIDLLLTDVTLSEEQRHALAAINLAYELV